MYSRTKKYFTFVIFRDIKKRFYSAIDTILFRKINDISKINDSNLKLYVDNMIDEHLVKQSEFIKNIRIDMLVNMEIISKHLKTIVNKSLNIKHNINIKDDVIMNVYKSDIEIYEQSKNMDLNNFLKILKIT